jgi:hypothetical protein
VVRDVGGRARGSRGTSERCLTNFNVNPLHVAGRFSHVDVVVILGIGDDGEDLGGELDRAALGVLRLGALAGDFVEGGAAACERWRSARGRQRTNVVWK